MANEVYLLTNNGDDVVKIYLSGTARTAWDGTGSPWTAQATTPFQLSMNDETGNTWTPTAAPDVPIWGGGPPFTNGRALIDRSYDNVTEPIGIQIYATGYDNAVTLKTLLVRALKQGGQYVPTLLVVQPLGAGDPVCFEIYDGSIQETVHFLNKEARGSSNVRILRCAMTITRSFAGGRFETGEVLFGTTSVGNNPDDGSFQQFPGGGVFSGEMVYDGSPMNVSLEPSAGITALYAATIAASYPITDGAGSHSITSATGAVLFTVGDIDATILLTNSRVQPRFVMRCHNAAGAEVRAVVRLANANGIPIFTSDWQPTGALTLVDFGAMPRWPFRRTKGIDTATLHLTVEGRVATGTTSLTVYRQEFLSVYDFCKIETPIDPDTGLITATNVTIDAFPEADNAACVPWLEPQAVSIDNTRPDMAFIVYGTLPRYWAGAGLWFAWQNDDGHYDDNDTLSMTASHAPLWMSLRGVL